MNKQKISDPGLQAFLNDQSATPRTVLVEVGLKAPEVTFERLREAASQTTPVRVVSTPATELANQKIVKKTAAALEKIVGGSSKWLPAGHTFIVTATSGQLRRVAELEEVVSVVAGDDQVSLTR